MTTGSPPELLLLLRPKDLLVLNGFRLKNPNRKYKMSIIIIKTRRPFIRPLDDLGLLVPLLPLRNGLFSPQKIYIAAINKQNPDFDSVE